MLRAEPAHGPLDCLSELAQDISEMHDLAQTMNELRRSIVDSGAHGEACNLSGGQRDAPGARHPVAQDVVFDLDEGAEASATDLVVALRMQQLLEMPFRAAMRCCPALRSHVERQEDSEEVADEFQEHWHPGAPDELLSVLDVLLREEWQQPDALAAERPRPRGGQARARADHRLPRARL
ncbi:unnamed protein product [Prorocentrum cordatum]|uniref:Uncharacterized protein n=1 Tax=Prorocentrum cordatum TaxID=2364126 RepID=A0ABN9RW52_9DINO|nr:unnamed protein product [Polarella glacialis]